MNWNRRCAERFTTRYGPWALVAGASEGLGAAFADALAACGLNLVLVARRKSVLRTVAGKLEHVYHVSVRCVVADLAVAEARQTVSDTCNDIDLGLIVYNAAYAPVGCFERAELGAVHQAVAVNVVGPLDLLHALLPGLKARTRAGVVLMSSLAGDQGAPRIATYAATKAFTTALAHGLWHELRPDGVDVTACVAGAVRTPGYTQAARTAGPRKGRTFQESREPREGREAPGTLDAPAVVRTALKALDRKPVVVPGSTNKIARFFMRRLLPVRAAVSIMAASTRNVGAGPTPENGPAQQKTGKEYTGG